MREPCEAKSLPGVVTRSNRKPVIYTDLQRSPESCRMLDVCPATPFHSDASEADQTRTNTKQKPQSKAKVSPGLTPIRRQVPFLRLFGEPQLNGVSGSGLYSHDKYSAQMSPLDGSASNVSEGVIPELEGHIPPCIRESCVEGECVESPVCSVASSYGAAEELFGSMIDSSSSFHSLQETPRISSKKSTGAWAHLGRHAVSLGFKGSPPAARDAFFGKASSSVGENSNPIGTPVPAHRHTIGFAVTPVKRARAKNFVPDIEPKARKANFRIERSISHYLSVHKELDRFQISKANRSYEGARSACTSVRRIGTGSFSTVLSGISKYGGKFAYKVVPRYRRGQEPIEGMIKEAQVLSELKALGKTQHIVRIKHWWYFCPKPKPKRRQSYCVDFDDECDEEGLVIQMELCLSGNLLSFVFGSDLRPQLALPGKRFNGVKACGLFLQIGSALKALHDLNCYHMDVKPANILLSRDGCSLKLADFGSVYDSRSPKPPSVGDSRYIARDQMNISQNDYRLFPHAKTDIFALGFSAYELAVGVRLPSDGDEWDLLRNGGMKLEALSGGEAEGKIRIPREITRLIGWMGTNNPDNRATLEEVLSLAWNCATLYGWIDVISPNKKIGEMDENEFQKILNTSSEGLPSLALLARWGEEARLQMLHDRSVFLTKFSPQKSSSILSRNGRRGALVVRTPVLSRPSAGKRTSEAKSKSSRRTTGISHVKDTEVQKPRRSGRVSYSGTPIVSPIGDLATKKRGRPKRKSPLKKAPRLSVGDTDKPTLMSGG